MAEPNDSIDKLCKTILNAPKMNGFKTVHTETGKQTTSLFFCSSHRFKQTHATFTCKKLYVYTLLTQFKMQTHKAPTTNAYEIHVSHSASQPIKQAQTHMWDGKISQVGIFSLMGNLCNLFENFEHLIGEYYRKSSHVI